VTAPPAAWLAQVTAAAPAKTAALTSNLDFLDVIITPISAVIADELRKLSEPFVTQRAFRSTRTRLLKR
jgi:hypothetical protein